MGVLLIGQLSALFIISQYAFLFTVWALALTCLGWRGVRLIWASLAMLIFLIPLLYVVFQWMREKVKGKPRAPATVVEAVTP